MPKTIDSRSIPGIVQPDISIRLRGTEDDPRSTPEQVEFRQEGLRLAKADIRFLSAVLKELDSLKQGPDQDEYGILRPTKFAFDSTNELLVNAAIVSALEGRQLPLGNVSTDSQGGVRVEWIRDAASVHLVVSSSDEEAAFVYHEVGDLYGTEDATPERLAHWLRTID